MLLKDRIDQPFNDRTIDASQIARFEALADEWWNPNGKFRVMHGFNTARLGYIEALIAGKFKRDLKSDTALRGVSILDIGCGGGLISEPLASKGAEVVGVDASSRNIEIARRHAQQSSVIVDYQHGTAETAILSGELFDVVLNLEVIEHVADPKKLITDCSARLKPGGMLIIATLNRTLRALILAIIGAEYVLRWLPISTHDWRRFLKPHEIETMLFSEGLRVDAVAGVSLNPLNRKWKITSNPSVNYVLVAVKPMPSSG
jgi:2-polyprenyl-6-hydroxyphenyl methylase/3-demethylubiquinone-9 3-methyltransferase